MPNLVLKHCNIYLKDEPVLPEKKCILKMHKVFFFKNPAFISKNQCILTFISKILNIPIKLFNGKFLNKSFLKNLSANVYSR